MCENLKTVSSRSMLAATYYKMGNLYMEYAEMTGQPDYIAQGVKAFEQDLFLSREADRVLQTGESRASVAVSCQSLASAYVKMQLSSQPGDGAWMEKGNVLYLEALAIAEKLYEEQKTVSSRRILCNICQGLCELYKLMPGEQSLKQAVAMGERAYEMGKDLDEALHTRESQEYRWYCANSFGAAHFMLHQVLKDRESYRRSFEIYQEAFSIAQEQMRKYRSMDSYEQFLASGYNLAMHPGMRKERALELLKNLGDLAGSIYRKTKNEKYQKMNNLVEQEIRRRQNEG